MFTKRCSICARDLAATSEFFRPCKNGAFGLHAFCRSCAPAYERQRRRKQPQREREHSRAYYQANLAKRRARRLALKIEAMRAYSNNDAKCAFCGERQLEFLTLDHPNNDGAAHRKRIGIPAGTDFYAFLKRNGWPDALRVLCMNCNCRRQYDKPPSGKYASQQRVYRRVRLEMLTSYSGAEPKCACCGVSELALLTLDHIDGLPDGVDRHSKIRGSITLWYWLRKHNCPPGFQVLCYNCNFAKGHYGFCHHHAEGAHPKPPERSNRFTEVNRSRKHGRTGTSEWHAWHNMVRCCREVGFPKYKYFGAKGITVADELAEFASFIAILGARPSPRHKLARRDPAGNFDKTNTAWLTPEELQQIGSAKSRWIEFNGKRQTLAEWARETGIDQDTIQARLDRHGYTIDQALTIPVGQSPKREYITFNGKTLTKTEWARKIGISVSSLFARFAKGLSVEEALKPPRKKSRK